MDKQNQIIENNRETSELIGEDEEEKNQGLDEIPDNERQVFVDKDHMSIFELKRRNDRGYIYFYLPHQRKEIWTEVKKSKLIESVLLSIPVPAIYFIEKNNGSKAVIDGQERLLAFFDFLDNRYELSNIPVLKCLNGKNFADLKPLEQRKIEDYKLNMFIIKKEAHPAIKVETFLRINQGTTLLNTREIRQFIL